MRSIRTETQKFAENGRLGDPYRLRYGVLSGLESKEQPVPVVSAVDRLAREYLDLTFDVSPMAATAYGVHEFDGLLDDLTQANLDAWVRKLAGLDRRLRTLRPRDSEEAADRDALAATVAEDLFVEEVEGPWRRNPFRAATAIPGAVLGLITRDFAPLEERLANVALRLEAAPRFLAQARALLDEPCPSLWRRMAIAATGSGAGFLTTALGQLAAGTAMAGRIDAAAAKAAGALRELGSWLEGDHAERFPDSVPFAIGEQAQARKLREAHCFETTPAELVAIGEAQIAEITASLVEQAAKLGSEDWAAKLDELKASHPSQSDLIPSYRKELERLEAFVFEHDLASNPASEATIQATPEFLRDLLGYAAYYHSGPLDQHQQGYFWVTPPQRPAGLRDHSFALIPPVAAHEGYPGHHLQIMSVHRLDSLVRRVIHSTVMIEGWGLYTEQLMHDVGYYDDEARLGQLSMRLFRALRIVLDMQLQSGALSYDEAVRRAMTVARLSETTARSEVARYTMDPTQPFGYLVGCLELERLRSETQARLGDAFRLRRFHDRVLSYGHMPPTLVRQAIAAADEAEQRKVVD
jgi:uncharacterized protein (DUF885 family)